MTAQPARSHAPETAPHASPTIDGIADALTGGSNDLLAARRMEFYRAVGQAEVGPDLQHVVATWWGQAMLDTDPDRDRIIAAVEAGTVATVTMAEVIRTDRASEVHLVRRRGGAAAAAQAGLVRPPAAAADRRHQ